MKKLIGIVALVAATMTATSCFTTGYKFGASKSEVKKAVTSGNWGSPKDCVVLFGSEYVDFYVYQQNPAFGYQRYEAQVSGSKTGTSIFLVSVAKPNRCFLYSLCRAAAKSKYTDIEMPEHTTTR